MGLDMYLSKRSYVKNWNHMNPKERHKITVKKGGKVRDDIRPERISYVVEEVGYWRKFNALHRWFVENIQNGVDDCREYYVDATEIQKLLETLKEVSAKRNEVVQNELVADKLLPTARGFFFGDVSYDEYYYDEVDRTIKLFEELLKEEGDYYYQSSW
jgi:hypothetical protein